MIATVAGAEAGPVRARIRAARSEPHGRARAGQKPTRRAAPRGGPARPASSTPDGAGLDPPWSPIAIAAYVAAPRRARRRRHPGRRPRGRGGTVLLPIPPRRTGPSDWAESTTGSLPVHDGRSCPSMVPTGAVSRARGPAALRARRRTKHAARSPRSPSMARAPGSVRVGGYYDRMLCDLDAGPAAALADAQRRRQRRGSSGRSPASPAIARCRACATEVRVLPVRTRAAGAAAGIDGPAWVRRPAWLPPAWGGPGRRGRAAAPPRRRRTWVRTLAGRGSTSRTSPTSPAEPGDADDCRGPASRRPRSRRSRRPSAAPPWRAGRGSRRRLARGCPSGRTRCP